MAVILADFCNSRIELFLVNYRVHLISNLYTQVEILLQIELVFYTLSQFLQVMTF